jgi:hypothetical protein
MSEITRILLAIERGDSQAAAELSPLEYDELRRLAAKKSSTCLAQLRGLHRTVF